MPYRLKLWLLKAAARWAHRHRRSLKRLVPITEYSRQRVGPINDREIRAEQIRKHVAGKTFLDAGCMYSTNGAYVFYAEQCGAARAMGLDVFAPTDVCLAHKNATNSQAEFFTADINDREMMTSIGGADVVFCNGVLYHTPDPFLMMTRLREITKETLLLYTSTVPEQPRLRNIAVFYPYLSDGQRRIWNPLGRGDRPGVSHPYEPDRGYANWFWGMTPSCVAALARCAGFNVDRIIRHRPFATMLVCSAGEKPRSALDPTIYSLKPRIAA